MLGLGEFERKSCENFGLIDDAKADSQPLFSVYLGEDADAEVGGVLLFGETDKSYYEGSISRVPVTRKGYWEVELEAVTLGGDDVGMTTRCELSTLGSRCLCSPRRKRGSQRAGRYGKVAGGRIWAVLHSLVYGKQLQGKLDVVRVRGTMEIREMRS
ncbi:hypothetical protein BJ742DRAFT_161564 [Cladochytrium replicatum]|nr:hypothetical protein BJ742DRAFT_161564 [Cladochytrium replicatum]